MNKIKELWSWVSFNVLLALFPIILSSFWSLGKDGTTWVDLLESGELFLISAGICANTVGRLVGSNQATNTLKPPLLAIAIIIISAASLLFARLLSDGFSPLETAVYSVNLFIASLCTGMLSIVIGNGD